MLDQLIPPGKPQAAPPMTIFKFAIKPFSNSLIMRRGNMTLQVRFACEADVAWCASGKEAEVNRLLGWRRRALLRVLFCGAGGFVVIVIVVVVGLLLLLLLATIRHGTWCGKVVLV